MDTLNKSQSTPNGGRNKRAHVRDAASELYNDGQKLASELYQEGLNKVNAAEIEVKEYSDELLKKVKENPLTSVLVAAGVGFLLSAFLRK